MLGLNRSCATHNREGTGRQPLRPEHERGPEPMRLRLAHWVALGAAPPDVAPSSIAAAHTRLTGYPPARDPERRAARAYSGAELRQALAALGRRPPIAPPEPPQPAPLDPLPLIWHAAAQRLPLPSFRMLLLHQGRLIALQERGRLLVAVVAAPPQWLPLIETRRAMVARALADTLARPVALELQEVAR